MFYTSVIQPKTVQQNSHTIMYKIKATHLLLLEKYDSCGSPPQLTTESPEYLRI
jgi:catechol-2,3-dioxygenase